jgi:hypothetical protein
LPISQGVDPHLILGILGTLSTKQAYTDLPSATPPDSANTKAFFSFIPARRDSP